MSETDSILRRAKDLFNRGQFGEAEAILRDFGDNDPATLNFRAYLLYRQNRHEEAERAYSSLVAVDDDPSHHMSLGLIRFKLNHIEDAKDSFEKVLANFEKINNAIVDSGCKFSRPHLIPLFLPFLALPAIRILSGGIVDVKNRSYIKPIN